MLLLPGPLKLKIHTTINCQYATILTYHSVIEDPLEFDIWTHMNLSLFEEHMQILSNESEVVSLNELTHRILKGKIRGNIVAVTFDDGFRNNYTTAYPILKKYNIPATIFLATDYVNNNNLFWPERISYSLIKTKEKTLNLPTGLSFSIKENDQKSIAYRKTVDWLKTKSNQDIFREIKSIENQLQVVYDVNDKLFQQFMPLKWDEIRSMEKEGLITFGGHTATHAILSQLTEEEAYKEMETCKSALDNSLEHEVKIWAYPNGSPSDYSDRDAQMLINLGFNSGIYTMTPDYISKKSDINKLGRFGVGNKMDRMELRAILSKRDMFNYLPNYKKLINMITSLASCLLSNKIKN